MSGAIIQATPAAQVVIDKLRAEHGDITFHASGGHRVTLVCLKAGELRIGARDRRLGEVYGVPFYLMTDEPDQWAQSIVTIGMGDGLPRGFSLEATLGRSFTMRRRVAGDATAEFVEARIDNAPRNRWLTKE